MMMLTIDTVRAHERFAYWREVLSQQFFHLRPERAGCSEFCAAVEAHTIGDLPLSIVTAAGQRIRRTRSEIARSPVPYYFANVHVGGTCSIRRRGEEIALSRGDTFIVDALHEFELDCEQRARTLVIRLPKEAIDARVARPDLVPGAVLPGSQSVARLLAGYLANGFETADHHSPNSAAMFAEHSVELVSHALMESWAHKPAPTSAWREALFVRACRTIRVRCGNPKLAPDQIARALGITTRLLQRIFAERGETIMRRLFHERVTIAAKLLAAPEAAHRSVTDIAYSCGFNDSAHFSRVFSAHTGMPPSHWRKEHGPSARQPANMFADEGRPDVASR